MNRTAKSIASTLLLLGITRGFTVPLWAAPDSRVREIELDPHQVVGIPVSSARVTTISFPSAITAMDAAMVSTGAKGDGLFQLAHQPGSSFFSVKTLVPNATTNVNVRWNHQTYILELRDSAEPVLSLILCPPTEPLRGIGGRSPRGVSPAALLGLLDKAKAFPLLQQASPEALRGVSHRAFKEDEAVSDFGDFEVRILEAFRFDAQDTLVFRVRLRNKTAQAITFRPDSFSVRAGAERHEQSVSDASGSIRANGESEAFFAITGTRFGGRNELALKNEFTVFVERIGQSSPTAPPSKVPAKSLEGFAK
ncbi:MAG: hypothetical protein RLZZ142_878 [Verrucomicrobiota bacterium]|jgi:hypothetical protein